MLALDDSKKIFSSFYIIGCDYSNLQKYMEDDKKESLTQYIQNIDLLITDLFQNENVIKRKNEKWLKIIKNSNAWLRIKYSKEYSTPITEIKIIECNCDDKNILFPKKYKDKGYNPIIITKIFKKNKQNINIKDIHISKELNEFTNFNDKFLKIPLNYNAKEYLKITTKNPCIVIAVSRIKETLPLKDIYIKHTNNKSLYKLYFYHYQPISSNRYMPKILDNYPPGEESNSSIALFCFPEGIKISEEYSMPKWFSFVLTDQLGVRTYGTILYFKEDLSNEKDFLNNCLPIYIDKNKLFFSEKGICILSRYPFYYNCKLFLKELYRIAFGNRTKIPLERIDGMYIYSFNNM